MGNSIVILLSLSACFFRNFCSATDTITPTQFIKDPECIISNGSIFKMGFFSPNGSTNRYVGIWYNIGVFVPNVIWVANRDKPLKDSSGVVTVSEEGNLLVLNGQNEILWSSNVSNTATNASVQLLDSGNLVLKEEINSNYEGDNNGRIIWESFEHPNNSFSTKMKIGTASRGEKQQLAFGSCNSLHSPICSCLRGFEPKNMEEWSRGNWTSGCFRRTQLQCERIKNGSEEGKEDVFLHLKMMKIPDFAEISTGAETQDKCKSECLKNCSCVAYAHYTGVGCMSWSGNLIIKQEFSSGVADLYLRLAYSELDQKGNIKEIIAITVPIGTITIAICTYFSWMWMAKQKGEAGPDSFDDKLQELPLFNFEMLATATNNFHIANKLGQGGFGPVYKGKLQDGQDIAVKRLSRASGQGLEEFMNEVVVISKLQHRNLVRLLGCCVEGEEKMLMYEYMPNKSLDYFLFDPFKQVILHWRKRKDIIEGVGRGLLYLHRDSRLKIIHRDLKASNILLDEELNPKISDFGMARIFGSNQNQADTRRVVGTYGYMSPEYAMEGRFSEKSDVFSFGVLLLEIVSGRRNTSFYQDEHSLTLLGVAWKLWNEDNIVALIDPVISDQCFQIEILRCIHVGLLCVQEFAKDRPSMSTVLSMLSSEIANLPVTKQPIFTRREITSDTESSQQSQKICSINNVTITVIEAR